MSSRRGGLSLRRRVGGGQPMRIELGDGGIGSFEHSKQSVGGSGQEMRLVIVVSHGCCRTIVLCHRANTTHGRRVMRPSRMSGRGARSFRVPSPISLRRRDMPESRRCHLPAGNHACSPLLVRRSPIALRSSRREPLSFPPVPPALRHLAVHPPEAQGDLDGLGVGEAGVPAAFQRNQQPHGAGAGMVRLEPGAPLRASCDANLVQWRRGSGCGGSRGGSRGGRSSCSSRSGCSNRSCALCSG